MAGERRAVWLAFLLLLLLVAGCDWDGKPPPEQAPAAPSTGSGQAPVASPALSAKALAEQETRLDATVWRDEVLARTYEQLFVRLADDLRRAANKVAVLGAFAFDEIALPKSTGAPTPFILGIHRQRFENAADVRLPHATWEQRLRQLSGTGWRIAQAEWYQEKFVPPREGKGAWSEFSFELHGERLAAKTRFILKGTLQVDWHLPSTNASGPAPARLTVANVTVWEREGAPAFNSHATVTPEPPEHRGEMVNMHPLIVTDLNGDGPEDIILSGVNKLFLNDGQANFTPQEFIAENVFRGSTDAGVVADFNGDGHADFVTVAKQGTLTNKLVLYAGRGAVPFGLEPVVAWEAGRIIQPSVATAGDIDRDGDLDLWVAQYKPPYKGGQLPTPYYDANDGDPSFLLLNDGRGKFEQATSARGLGAKRFRRTFAASFADLDADGDLDLITINDYAGVDLHYNDGAGQFTDQTARLYNPHLFGMGHCIVDFDRDGLLDVLAIGMSVPTVRRLEFMKLGRDDFPMHTRKRVDMGYGNRVYVSRSGQWIKPGFADQLATTGWSWGTTAFDCDNNGMLDVHVANGHVSGLSIEDYDPHIWTHDIYVGSSREDPQLLAYFDGPFRGLNTGKTSSNGYQPDCFFLDVGTNDYINVAFLMGIAHVADTRAVVSADLNQDGKLDLVLTEGEWFGGPHTGRNRLHVHLNQLSTGHHWVGFKLVATKPGVSPLGATVRAKTDDRIYIAQIISGDSYQSQHPNTVHFGLGQATRVREVTIRWPNGQTQTLENPAVDRYHRIAP